jgi:hypothetical protein
MRKKAGDKLKFSDELSFWVKAQFRFFKLSSISLVEEVKHNKAKTKARSEIL